MLYVPLLYQREAIFFIEWKSQQIFYPWIKYNQINMIQDQNFKEEQQNILNNPQSLEMIKHNLALLIHNDKAELFDLISHISNHLSTQALSPNQPQLSSFNNNPPLDRSIQDLKERISQKSYQFSSVIQLTIRMINYISQLQVKSIQQNQAYSVQIDHLQNMIEDLTNRNSIFQIDLSGYKEQLQHARGQINQIILEKECLKQNYMWNQKEIVGQKDLRIQHLELELQSIKDVIRSYKNKKEMKVDPFLEVCSNDNTLKGIEFHQQLQIPNLQMQTDLHLHSVQSTREYEQYIKYLQDQNNKLKVELHDLQLKTINKKHILTNKISKIPSTLKLKTQPTDQEPFFNNEKSDKMMYRSYTSKVGIGYIEESSKKQSDINTFLQLLRIKEDNTSIRRDLSRQSLVKIEEFNIYPEKNEEWPEKSGQKMQRNEDDGDYKCLKNDQSKSSFNFIKRNPKQNIQSLPYSSSLVYLTQQQEQSCQNEHKQKYQWFFQSQQIDNQVLPSSSSSINPLNLDKSYSSIGINTMTSSLSCEAPVTIRTKNMKDKRKSKDKIQQMPQRQDSKSYFQLISNFAVRNRIKRRTTRLPY